MALRRTGQPVSSTAVACQTLFSSNDFETQVTRAVFGCPSVSPSRVIQLRTSILLQEVTGK